MNTRIRVLHIVPELTLGGVENTVEGLTLAADRRRFQPAVVSLAVSAPKIEAAGIPVICLNKRPGFDLKLLPKLRQTLLDFEPHIVHTYDNVLPYAWPVASTVKHPIVQVHTISGNPATTDRFRGWLQNRAFRHSVTPVSAGRNAVAGALHIPAGIFIPALGNSESSAKKWREREGFAETDFLIACADRLEQDSQHTVLIDAFTKIASTGAKLLLLSDGALQHEIQAQAKAQGVANQVVFLKARTDVAAAFAAADVVASASVAESSHIPMMQAMAAGRACVAMSANIIEDNRSGLLAKPRDVAGLAEALARLVDSPHLRSRLGYAARERAVAEFDQQKMAQAYEALYLRLLSSKNLVAA